MSKTSVAIEQGELPGKEECPGHFTWSAFGADYMDTVCSTACEWGEGDEPSSPTLCDADDDFRPKDVPCPFCSPVRYVEYVGHEERLAWALDKSPVDLTTTEPHFHEIGQRLFVTATHPERGEERLILLPDED